MIENYSQTVKYREPLLLFHNDGKRLVNVSAAAGPAFSRSYAARGLAIGDYDNDGRLDVLVAPNGGTPLLLQNHSGVTNHWIGLRLRGTRANRDGVGARIIWSAGGVRRSRLKNNGGSYLSSHDPREILGLGMASRVDWVEVHWPPPSERVDRLTNPPVGRYIDVLEGRG